MQKFKTWLKQQWRKRIFRVSTLIFVYLLYMEIFHKNELPPILRDPQFYVPLMGYLFTSKA